jgi:hypothetical protein
MNSNITTEFLTEQLLTLQDFLQVFNLAATGFAADLRTIFYFVPQLVQESDTYQSYGVN